MQKAGTTALHDFLAQHPQIALLRDQALHFFDNEEHFADEPDYRILHGNFKRSRSWRIAGEVTPDYLYWPQVIPRIARYNPRMKVIVSLRNPATRAFSHWNMRRKIGREPLEFIDAINADRARSMDPVPPGERRYGYIERSLYAEQIRRVFHHFPREQVLIVKHETFRADYTATMNDIFDFLGVPRVGALKNPARNTARYDRKMTAEERASVTAICAVDIRELEALLGWDCSDWLQPRAAT